LFTIAGGLKAVVCTDAIQALLLLFGSDLLKCWLYEKLKIGTWEAVKAVTPAQHFQIACTSLAKTCSGRHYTAGVKL